MKEIVPGIRTWSVYSEGKGFNFNGYAVATRAGTVLIDPPDMSGHEWEMLDALAPFESVFVTNRNHSRAASACRDRYGVPVRLHELDAPGAKVDADETVRGGERVGDALEVVHVPGKSPGEIAFYAPAGRALVVGDVVIGVPAGELSTYPDEVIEDREELLRSAAKLLEYDFDALLTCDGTPLPVGGKERLKAFVQAASSSS